jgi:hypothetical protein
MAGSRSDQQVPARRAAPPTMTASPMYKRCALPAIKATLATRGNRD